MPAREDWEVSPPLPLMTRSLNLKELPIYTGKIFEFKGVSVDRTWLPGSRSTKANGKNAANSMSYV